MHGVRKRAGAHPGRKWSAPRAPGRALNIAHLDESVHEILDRIADADGISKSEVVRRGLRDYAQKWLRSRENGESE